ncbi:ABC transporter permease [Streptomyces thermodiastaticus]|jgi:ABC-2 type transport system permease protein|nr:ABC transporter permease [Streptomyces thermodiastaticus]
MWQAALCTHYASALGSTVLGGRDVGALRLYAAVAAGGFRRYATYRVATAAGVFTNTVFGVILVHTYLALWDARPHLGGYDQAQAVTYVWVGQALLATLAIGGGGVERDLMERIRTGDVAVDLYRPADLQAWWLAADLGRALFQMVGRGLVPLLFGALFFPVALPADPVTWAAFAGTVLSAMVVSFALRYLVALSVFWLLDGMGVAQVAHLVGYFCSGMLLPLNVFPGLLGEVVRLLPWSALLQNPADVLLGHADPLDTYVFQGAWAAALLALGRLLQRAATRRVVVQGG